ncbi:uncharacterized protein [Haliotis asinina]|uniref:uncharacterized protein n=1 Tax=Haliotis asinina TaxID=109174 RepID=UPI003531A062
MSQHTSGSIRNEKKRRLDFDHTHEHVSQNTDSWARFRVIEASDHEPIKLNPFAISKAIQGICGEVKNVSRLRGGSLLVECARRQQSLNLLSVTKFANVDVAVSVHRTLNSCRGIVRDRAHCLLDMSEQEIAAELESQGVTSVKRFSTKQDGIIRKTNTYLFTFSQSTLPQFIKAGYFNIGVEMYIPNPLRCYNCQQFGHGSRSCSNSMVCHRCSGNHDGSDCENDFHCSNCGDKHMASSKLCPQWQRQAQIMKIKCQNNISFAEAKKLVTHQSTPSSSVTYAAAAARPVAAASVMCQTEMTWIRSDQPVNISTVTDASTKCTSETQTQNELVEETDSQSELTTKKPGTTHMSQKDKKKT